MSIASHTLVKNGMPFIGSVLRQVAPFMDKMFITISQYSSDGTIDEVRRFMEETKALVELAYEGNTNPAELTKVRQFQVDRTKQDWILFLDDDDWWPQDQLEACLKELNDDVDGLGVNPYQVISKDSYDSSWDKTKYFTKFFRNQDINYRGDWPEDWIYKGDQILYWKKNKRVKPVPYRFYHLALVKHHSFRNETLPQYKYRIKTPKPIILPEELAKLI